VVVTSAGYPGLAGINNGHLDRNPGRLRGSPGGYSRWMERAVWSVVLVLVWVASLTVLTWQEFAVAAAVAIPVATVATMARRALAGRWRIRATWLRPLWRLPGAVLTETVTVWRAAFRRMPGRMRELRLGEERSQARQAIAVPLLSASPGTVVTGVDTEANVARLHGFSDAAGAMERAVRP
jgi:multisubunit Na+/H+ antiporter MnhE subunit